MTLLVAVVSPAHAEDVAFYGHTHGHGRDAPMPVNTQFPRGESDYSLGSSAPAVDSEAGGDDGGNELYFYSTPGLVSVRDYNDFDYAKVHSENGQTKDILLDTRKSVRVVMHMSADQTVGAPITPKPAELPKDAPWVYPFINIDYGVQPNFRVHASLLMAITGAYGEGASTAPSIDALQDVRVIAEGESPVFDLVSAPDPISGAIVHAIEIDLGTPTVARIPKEYDFYLKIEWSNSDDGATRVTLPMYNVNGGEWFPNRFVLPVKNPIDVEVVHPEFVNGRLVIHGVTNTPWGSYDVDLDALRLDVTDADGRPVEPSRIVRVTDRSVAHGGHYRPVNVTWIWDYSGDALPAGTYAATVVASNLQGSATASTTATFAVLEGGRPGPVARAVSGLASAGAGDVHAEHVAGGASEASLDEAPRGILPAIPFLTAPALILLTRKSRRTTRARARKGIILALVICAPLFLAGCFGNDDGASDAVAPAAKIDDKQVARFEKLTARLPQNYSFPAQRLLAASEVWYNDSLAVGPTGVEGFYDQGGIKYATALKTFDVTDRVPPGVATELMLTLTWQNEPGASSDLDIFVDFQGERSDASDVEYYLDFTRATKRLVVNVQGEAGVPALIGVQAANGFSANPLPFALRAEYRYAKDVLTPRVPLAFTLPANATGIILGSEKAGGDEHVRAAFILIGPDDLPVGTFTYDDIGIPTESMYIPLPRQGEYVFYAYNMSGGFLSITADAGLPDNRVRTLERVIERVEVNNEAAGEGETRFTPAPFALEVRPRLVGENAVVASAQLLITSQRGEVAAYTRTARIDMDDANRVGYTADETNSRFDPTKLSPGEYTLSWAVEGLVNAGVAYEVVTYAR